MRNRLNGYRKVSTADGKAPGHTPAGVPRGLAYTADLVRFVDEVAAVAEPEEAAYWQDVRDVMVAAAERRYGRAPS